MLVKEKSGNIKDVEANDRHIYYLVLEWYETNKRILQKKTLSGKEVTLRFLKETQKLTQGDIICLNRIYGMCGDFCDYK